MMPSESFRDQQRDQPSTQDDAVPVDVPSDQHEHSSVTTRCGGTTCPPSTLTTSSEVYAAVLDAADAMAREMGADAPKAARDALEHHGRGDLLRIAACAVTLMRVTASSQDARQSFSSWLMGERLELWWAKSVDGMAL